MHSIIFYQNKFNWSGKLVQTCFSSCRRPSFQWNYMKIRLVPLPLTDMRSTCKSGL